MAAEPLYFDDLQVGDRFSTGTYQVGAEDIKRFAEAFDPQPFHLDDAAA
jgi:acyl dehydratase